MLGDHSKAGRDLRLLVLDGGGVRGLSSLQTLKQLMELIDPENPPKPCECFDMIGGTSTGGLIAIMLGRLEMSVDECIAEYQQISSTVFTKVRHRLNWRGQVQGRFDEELLAEKVREVLVKKGFNEQEPLKQSIPSSGCKTFVCTTSKETSDTAILSTYFSKRRGTSMLNRVKIWEAARATSAATSFFNPINIGTEGFVDGATGANNPINELWTEAYDIWKDGTDWSLDDHIRCMVSIGTGVPTLKAFRDNPIDVAKALVQIALDTEKTAETFQRHHSALYIENRAFRFNVIRGLEDVGLEEASKEGQILAATRRYLQSQEVFGLLEKCSKALKGKEQQEWLRWLYEESELEAQELLDFCESCTPTDHKTDELLLGYTCASPFQKWKACAGSILWCQRKADVNTAHAPIASCVLRQMMNTLVSSPPEVLYFRCEAGFNNSAAGPSLPLKLGKGESWGPEIILKSFISQAVKRGFVSAKTASTSHDTLLGYLTETLGSLLEIRDCNILLVVDSVEHVMQTETTDFLGSMDYLTGKYSKKCWVLLGGTTTAHLIEAFKGLPFVNEETERQECLQSLHDDAYHARRDEIALAIGNSNQWIWNHPVYKSWESLPSGALTILGKPGSGKSVLAKTIQRKFSNISDLKLPNDSNSNTPPTTTGDPPNLASGWFYSRRKGESFKSHRALMRALLFEFLDQDPRIFSQFRDVYRRNSSSAIRHWTIDELKEVLVQLASSNMPFLIVIDAIDEAEDDSLLLFVEGILQNPATRMKFILLSRPTRRLDRKLWRSRQILLHDENSKDIEEVVNHGLIAVQDAMHYLDSDDEEALPFVQHHVPKYPTQLPYGPKTTRSRPCNSERMETLEALAIEDLRTEILSRANGIILWTVLVLDALLTTIQKEIMFTFKELVDKVKCLPLDLNRLYKEFVRDLQATLDSYGLAKARKTLMLINSSSELKPLNLEELWDALAVPDRLLSNFEDMAEDPISHNRIPIRSWGGFVRVLRGTCGPFIDIRSTSRTGRDEIGPESIIQLMHQTTKEFLSSREDAGPLYFQQLEAMTMVENLIIQYCKIALPAVPTKYSPLPSSKWTPSSWKSKVEDIAIYLEDKKLLPFCSFLLAARKPLSAPLGTNIAIIEDAFIFGKAKESSIYTRRQNLLSMRPDEIYASPDATAEWIKYITKDPSWWSIMPGNEIDQALGSETYDIGQGACSAIIGRLFYLSTSHGLVTAVRSLLGISSLIDCWTERYQDTVLNAALFTVLDFELTGYRETLIGRGHRRHKSVMAIDNLYWDRTEICGSSGTGPAEAAKFSEPNLSDVTSCIELIVNHKSFSWMREEPKLVKNHERSRTEHRAFLVGELPVDLVQEVLIPTGLGKD